MTNSLNTSASNGYALEMAEIAAAESDFFDAGNVKGFLLELGYIQTQMANDPTIPFQVTQAINTIIGNIESEIPGATDVPPNYAEMTAAIQAMFPNDQPNAIAQSITQALQNIYGVFQSLGSSTNYAIEMADTAAAETDFWNATSAEGFMIELGYIQTALQNDGTIPPQVKSAINTIIANIEAEIPGASSVPPDYKQMAAAIQAMFAGQQPNAVAQSILQSLQNIFGVFKAL